MLIAKNNRLKTAHLGALAKIVACLVVNIFQPASREERGAKRLELQEEKCQTERRTGDVEHCASRASEFISDDESACQTDSH